MVKRRGSKDNYKQMPITAFFVSKSAVLNMSRKVKYNEFLASCSNTGQYMEDYSIMEKSAPTESTIKKYKYLLPLPRYVPPVVDDEASIISLDSDEEDISSSPVIQSRTFEMDNVNSCTTLDGSLSFTAGKTNENLSSNRFLPLEFKKHKHLLGVFPPTKVDVQMEKPKPRILLEKSKSNQSLSFPTFVSDEKTEDSVLVDLTVLSESFESVSSIQFEGDPSNLLKQIKFDNVTSSPVQNVAALPAIGEDNELNWNYMLNFKHIYGFVLSHPNLSILLQFDEIQLMDVFLNVLPQQYAYVCIRLFLRVQKWNNVFKLKNEIKLLMSDLEVKDMYDCLLRNNFIVADLSTNTPSELLELLTVIDIKDICKSFKIKTIKEKKCTMIKKLLDNCNHQPILVSYKSTRGILEERIHSKLGICVKLNSTFYKLLQKIHLLYSFTTNDFKSFSDLYFFLHKIQYGDIVLPKYTISKDTIIFRSFDKFVQYTEAKECRKAMEDAFGKKHRSLMLELCELAYRELIDLDDSLQDQKPLHLFCFNPVYVYTKALSFGVRYLTKHYPERVEEFLTLLLSRNVSERMRGHWYDLLAMMQYTYCKKPESAAETVIKALGDKSLTEVQRCILNHRAENIKNNKSKKISKLVTDRICFAQAGNKLPFIEIDAKAIQSERSTGKKHYVETINGEIVLHTVEELALNHYLASGYTNGFHCEGSLIWTIFFTLLWDNIYDSNVPDVFVSEIQYLPLDFYSKEFYIKRRDAIDELFENILHRWTHKQLAQFIRKNWIKNSNKKSLIDRNLNLDHKQIFEIILCLECTKLVQIFQRMLSDMGTFKSGLPDLFLWNPESKLCKFVEVKSDKDKLSCKQEVWLRFLKSINVDVEVCHVHSIGTKSRACYKKRQ